MLLRLWAIELNGNQNLPASLCTLGNARECAGVPCFVLVPVSGVSASKNHGTLIQKTLMYGKIYEEPLTNTTSAKIISFFENKLL